MTAVLPSVTAGGDLLLLSKTPRRQRWSVPAILHRPRLAAAVEAWLQKSNPTWAVTVNALTGRILLEGRQALADTSGALAEALARPPVTLAELKIRQTAANKATKARKLVTKLFVGGFKLLLIAANGLLWGAGAISPIAAPLAILSIAGTIITGYDFLRALVRTVTGRSGITTGTLIGAATLSSLMLRENVTALVVLWLLNLGEYLEILTLRRTRKAIRELLSTEDDEVWLLHDGVERSVRVSEVTEGQLVSVRAGRRVPVDGFVESGEAFVDQAAITGESMPVKRSANDSVYAGTIVASGSLQVRVTGVGSDTVVGRLIQRVEEAQTLRPRIQTVGDSFARRVVPSSFAAALLVFLVTRDPRRALTMMLVACPCAAGLATPTAVSASIGNGARRGILIKGGTHLEAMAGVDTVCFDKTGTLTESQPTVQHVYSLDSNYDERRVLALAAQAERYSQHPLGLAILDEANRRTIAVEQWQEEDGYEIASGQGIRTWNSSGEVLAGNERLILERGIASDAAVTHREQMVRDAATGIYIAHQGRLVGLVTVTAGIRPEAAASIVSLKKAGVKHVMMLTGDTEPVAKAVASAVGIDEWQSGLLPQEKFKAIEQLRAQGKCVAMVGDGINDAPALALADVGIAMGTSGSDVAIETADVALAADDLQSVTSVMNLSRQTMSVIRQNYGLALGTNSIGLYLAAVGSINPIIAAVLHNLSTILVIGNSTRLIGFDPSGRGTPLQRRFPSAHATRHASACDDESACGCTGGTSSADQKALHEQAA